MQELFIAILQDITDFFKKGSTLPPTLLPWAEEKDLQDFQLGSWELLSLREGKKIRCTSRLSHAVIRMICIDLRKDAIDPSGHIGTYMKKMRTIFTKRTQEAILSKAVQKLDPLAPLIIVESALPIETDLAQKIQKDILHTYHHGFVKFRTNTELLGGLHLYVHGTKKEFSLRLELDQIFSHLYLNV